MWHKGIQPPSPNRSVAMHKMVMSEKDGICNECFQTFHMLMVQKKRFFCIKRNSAERSSIGFCFFGWISCWEVFDLEFGIHGGNVIYIERRLKQKITTKKIIFQENELQQFWDLKKLEIFSFAAFTISKSWFGSPQNLVEKLISSSKVRIWFEFIGKQVQPHAELFKC